jgi:hypothetical protein
MENSPEGQERICVQKIFESAKNEAEMALINQTTSPGEYEQLSAAFYSSKLWEIDATVRVFFMEEKFIPRTKLSAMNTSNGPIDPLQQFFFDNPLMKLSDCVKKIVNERIVPLVQLNIVFVDDVNESDVRISFNRNSGCWSLLGTDAMDEKDLSKSTMNFAWFDVSTVMHEFGHMLGMIHEHQNPKGKGIQWNEKAVFKWAGETQQWDAEKTQKNILDKYNKKDINGSDFDPLSIMLYFFPANLTLNNKGTYQNLRLSGKDVEFITKNYSDETRAPVVFKEFYGQNILQNIKQSEHMAKFSPIPIIVACIVLLAVVVALVLLFRRRSPK